MTRQCECVFVLCMYIYKPLWLLFELLLILPPLLFFRFRYRRSVQVDLLEYCLATHVACAERFGTMGARAVPAQEGHIPFSLHANTAEVRLLKLQHFVLQIAK